MINLIVGLRVLNAEHVHDYIQIHFDQGIILSIYNEIVLIPVIGVSDLRSQFVVDVAEDDKILTIKFSCASLRVDLDDSAFKGPEAMSLFCPGLPEIVWN